MWTLACKKAITTAQVLFNGSSRGGGGRFVCVFENLWKKKESPLKTRHLFVSFSAGRLTRQSRKDNNDQLLLVCDGKDLAKKKKKAFEIA